MRKPGWLPVILPTRSSALLIATLWCAAISVPVTSAHEPDQYNVPGGRQFADIGPDLSRWFFRAIDGGVKKTNEQIRHAIEQQRSQREIDRLSSPEQLVANVNAQFPYAVTVIEDLDAQLPTARFTDRYPGVLSGYKSPPDVGKFLMFPLNPLRAWTCGSFKAYGVMVGSDKIGHFTDMGRHYYNAYAAARRAGKSEEQAVAEAVAVGTDDPVMSEKGVLGYMTAGAYSNADLAANFSGMMFYRNLYEPVKLKGVDRPPMLERDGPYWRLAPHVRPDADLWSWFVSDHYDEALNPSLYLDFMRSSVRDWARRNASAIVTQRADPNGQPHSREWFDRKTHELRTYWGVNYGHRGSDNELIMIHDVCFANGDQSPVAVDRLHPTPLHLAIDDPKKLADLCSSGPDINATDVVGRTALHWAARTKNLNAIETLLAHRADPNVRDRDGRTALFDAAGTGDPAVVAVLLRGGADPNAQDGFHATPIHAAVAARGENVADVVDLLVRGGAMVNAQDDFGCTPLHNSIRRGDEAIVAALLDHGGDANIADAYGVTPLHLTAFRGFGAMARLLVDHGANVQARSVALGTPIDVAAKSGHDELAATLRSAAGPRALSTGGRR